MRYHTFINYIALFFILGFSSCGSNEQLRDDIFCGEEKDFPNALWEVDFPEKEYNRFRDNNYVVTENHIVFPITEDELCIVNNSDGSYKTVAINKTKLSIYDYNVFNDQIYIFVDRDLVKIDIETLEETVVYKVDNFDIAISRTLDIKIFEDEIYLIGRLVYDIFVIRYNPSNGDFEKIELPSPNIFWYDFMFYRGLDDSRNTLIIERDLITYYNMDSKIINYQKIFEEFYVVSHKSFLYKRDQGILGNAGRAFFNLSNTQGSGLVFDYYTGEDLYTASGMVLPLDDKYAVLFSNTQYPSNIVHVDDGSIVEHLNSNTPFYQLQLPLFLMSDKFLINHKFNSDLHVINLETGCNEYFIEHNESNLYVIDLKSTNELIMLDYEEEKISKFSKF